MITKEQIDIFLKYNGDVDGFVRCDTNLEKGAMTDEIWSLIDNIVFDLHLLNSNLASKEKNNLITESLENHIDNEFFIELLIDFVTSK